MHRRPTTIASVAALVLLGAVLAACGVGGGGGGVGDCVDDVPNLDWNEGASVSYSDIVLSCSNSSSGDTDQYLYDEDAPAGGLTIRCDVVAPGAGDPIYLSVYLDDPDDPSGGEQLDSFECSDDFTVTAGDTDPGEHLLIEVDHLGGGSVASVTVQ